MQVHYKNKQKLQINKFKTIRLSIRSMSHITNSSNP